MSNKRPLYRIEGEGRDKTIIIKNRPFNGVEIDALIEKYRKKLETHEPKYVPRADEREGFYHVNSYIVGHHWRRRPSWKNK
jgi:hypothetical protein